MDVVYNVTTSELTAFIKEHASTFRGLTSQEQCESMTITPHFHREGSSATEMVLSGFSHFLVTFMGTTPSFHYTARQVADMVVEYLSVKHPAVLGLSSGYSFVLIPNRTGDMQLGRLELTFAGSLF